MPVLLVVTLVTVVLVVLVVPVVLAVQVPSATSTTTPCNTYQKLNIVALAPPMLKRKRQELGQPKKSGNIGGVGDAIAWAEPRLIQFQVSSEASWRS